MYSGKYISQVYEFLYQHTINHTGLQSQKAVAAYF